MGIPPAITLELPPRLALSRELIRKRDIGGILKFGIAGAGFSGAVVARELADAGHDVVVFDTRHHVGGNCFTSRDTNTGVMIHRYGPHIFHTGDEEVWTYINRFGTMMPYQHRVRTTVGGRVFSLPVNLMTINQLFETALSPGQARELIQRESDTQIVEPTNFEEQALKLVGSRLYRTFFYGYTKKQWGVEPTQLPASILKRLPVRFSYDDSYFNHPFQAIPKDGYTPIVESILDHDRVSVKLDSVYDRGVAEGFDHTIWTGPLDSWFDYQYGHLGYRTLDFVEERSEGDFQGCSVMNYGDEDVPFTRITEHKHFAPWEDHAQTVVFREYSRAAMNSDIPYYPIRLAQDQTRLQQYLDDAKAARGVTFAGRLGTYRYLDMDVTIREALDISQAILRALSARLPIPSTIVDL